MAEAAIARGIQGAAREGGELVGAIAQALPGPEWPEWAKKSMMATGYLVVFAGVARGLDACREVKGGGGSGRRRRRRRQQQ